MSSSSSVSETAPVADQRSAEWFAAEIHAHEAALKSYLRQAFPQARAEVDDVVQESYLRVWKAGGRQPLIAARAFLFTVARRITLDLLRRNRTSPFAPVGDLTALPVIADGRGVAEAVGVDEKVALLVQALVALPPRGRAVVMLRKLKGLSQKEVAAQLGIAEKTVDEHLSRAMKRLGEYLRQRGVSEFRER